MKKFMLSFMLTIGLYTYTWAQTNTIQIKVLSETEQEPLVGATVYFETLGKGTVTDLDGVATFVEIPAGEHPLRISYLGFETLNTSISLPARTELVFSLSYGGTELEEVVLQSSRSTRTIQKIPTRIELIGAEELGEKAMMNPTNISMVLRESTGIQMQQTSLSSGNSNIRIQGLDGRYTQLLRDGFPLYGGFSSGLSIMQIPPLDLQQFEIVKGSSSTLYGGGAIAGLVNMVSKTPGEEPSLDIMLTQTHAKGSTANAFYSKRDDKFGLTLYASGHLQKPYDPEDDGFSNLPKTKSISFNPKFYYYPSKKTTFWFGVNGTLDSRIGGDINKIENSANDEHQYTEENVSKRMSTQAFFETQIDTIQSVSMKNSLSFFDRELTIPDLIFSGSQFNSFSEATYRRQMPKTDLVVGANLYTVSFNEDETGPLDRSQKDITAGLFAKYILDLSRNWILETGLRTDYTDQWGVFPLPRLSILYKNDSGFSSRIGGGLGYKLPDIFTEEAEFINFRNILPINKDVLNAERSYGFNLDFNFQTRIWENISFSINQLFYVSAITDGLLLNSTSEDFFQFENAPGKILSKGAESNIKFTYKDFRWFLNYALIDTRLHYLPGNPRKPLTAKHNAGSVLMYENETWRFGFETYYTGKQFLSDGTKTTDFFTLGFLGVRNFNWGSLFVNFENFTDRRQSRFSPLVLPPHEDPVFPEIYAPTDGFIFSFGAILKPFGNHEH